MKDFLYVDSINIDKFIVEETWYNSKKSMLFARFASFDMCHIIFSKMHNLHGIGRVEKYIHPLLRSVYQSLQEKEAFTYRHDRALQTRIDYTPQGLSLLVKKKGDTLWLTDTVERSLNVATADTPKPLEDSFEEQSCT